jgi:histidyl-tRNA synthetase
MKKQMKYADQKQVVYVAMVGTTEIENNTVSVKSMETGHQEDVKIEDLVAYIKK